MKYILNQNLVCIENKFQILDNSNDLCYTVSGKISGIGERLHFNDANGNKIFKIKKKILKATDTYQVDRGYEYYGMLKRKLFSDFNENYFMDTPYGELVAKGDFSNYDFSFFDEYGTRVAKVFKDKSFENKYFIDIHDFDDEGLILAFNVIIDIIEHNNED